MKALVINEKNAPKIDDIIKAAEGRATARTITAADIIKECDAQLIKLYGLGASLKSLTGTKICIDINAQKFPSAYKYTPDSTHFEAVFDGRAWRLYDVYRYTCTPNRGSIQLPENAQKMILANIANAGASCSGRRNYRGKIERI